MTSIEPAFNSWIAEYKPTHNFSSCCSPSAGDPCFKSEIFVTNIYTQLDESYFALDANPHWPGYNEVFNLCDNPETYVERWASLANEVNEFVCGNPNSSIPGLEDHKWYVSTVMSPEITRFITRENLNRGSPEIAMLGGSIMTKKPCTNSNKFIVMAYDDYFYIVVSKKRNIDPVFRGPTIARV